MTLGRGAIFAVLAALVLAAVGVTAHVFRSAGSEPAACLSARISAQELFRAGFTGEKPTLGAWDRFVCRASAQDAEKALEHSSAKDRQDYLRGVFARLAPQDAPMDVKERTGTVALAMMRGLQIRHQATWCWPEIQETLRQVQELDEPILRLWLARYAGYNNVQDQMSVSLGIVLAVDQYRPKQPACDDVLKRQLDEHIKTWQAVAQGSHPWTPGCTIRGEESEFVIRCED